MPNRCLFIRYLLCANHCPCAEDNDTKALGTKITCSVHLICVFENRIQNQLLCFAQIDKTGNKTGKWKRGWKGHSLPVLKSSNGKPLKIYKQNKTKTNKKSSSHRRIMVEYSA